MKMCLYQDDYSYVVRTTDELLPSLVQSDLLQGRPEGTILARNESEESLSTINEPTGQELDHKTTGC